MKRNSYNEQTILIILFLDFLVLRNGSNGYVVMMATTPSWVQKFDRPRSLSMQPNSPEYWDLAKTNLYQPLKWHPNYQSPTGSPTSDSDVRSTSTLPKQPRSSLTSLLPIPEDGFMDDAEACASLNTSHSNSAFELQEQQAVSHNRRFSDSDIISGKYQRRLKYSDNGNNRKQKNNSGSKSRRKSLDYLAADDKSVRSDGRSDTGRSEASVKSGRSVRSGSTKSEDTQLMSLDSSSIRSDKRGSDASSRRKSVDMMRGRSASVVSRTMQSDSAAAFAQIEIPVELLESPTKRLKRLLGPVIMCVLVMTLAASLGAAIYFATVLKDTQQQAIEELVKANLELRVRSAAQTEDLSTLSYQRLRSIGRDYCKQMDIFYKESVLFEKTYKSCKVISIENGKINFTLSFDKHETITKDILNVIEERGEKVAGTTARMAMVDKLTIELDNAKIIVERIKNPNSKNPEVTKTVIADPDTNPLTEKLVSAKPSPKKLPFTLSSHTSTTTTTTTTTTVKITDLEGVSYLGEVSREESCVGNHGGYLAHHSECNLFYRCQEGQKILFACAGNLVFDINKKVCVHPSNYDHCPQKVTNPTDATGFNWGPHDPWNPCKTNHEFMYFPHPRECNLFFHCDHNMSIVRVCQTGLLYDWKLKICVPKSNNVICPDPTHIAPTETTVNQNNTNITYPARPDYNRTPCKNTTSFDIFPHPDNCSLYIMCDSSGRQATIQCPNGLLYDPAIKACTRVTNQMPCPDIRPCRGLSGVYFPHPTKCNLFIFCNANKEVVQSCAVGMVWDPTIDTCVMRTATSVCPPEVR